MTDKVQKIREEVERIQLYTQSEVLKQVLDIIDKVQKEPVSDTQSPVIFYGLTGSVGSPKEEPVSEDLKQAIHNAIFALDERKGYTFKLEYMFMAGAKWQKEHMMAKAFSAEIDSSCCDGRCILGGNFARFETGDKVKVIVIKDD